MVLSNLKMTEMIHQLQPLLSHRDIVGYYAARNYRILSTELTEFEHVRNELVEKYGEPNVDESDDIITAYTVDMDSENGKKFMEELTPYTTITHEVSIQKLSYESVIGILTGEEILAIDWMLED